MSLYSLVLYSVLLIQEKDNVTKLPENNEATNSIWVQ